MDIKIKSDDLLTVPEAARRLGRPKMTLYRWIRAGKIIYAEVGGVLFISKNVVESLKRQKNERAAGNASGSSHNEGGPEVVQPQTTFIP